MKATIYDDLTQPSNSSDDYRARVEYWYRKVRRYFVPTVLAVKGVKHA